MKTDRLTNHKHDRQGFAMVIVLVAIFVLSIAAVAVYRTLGSHRDTIRRTHWQVQSERLADAALQRALFHLRDNPEYKGETWQPTTEEEPTDKRSVSLSMKAQITVEADDSGRTIQVVADVPDHPTHRARTFRTATLPADEMTPNDESTPPAAEAPDQDNR